MSEDDDSVPIADAPDELPAGPLVPLYRRVAAIQRFREVHGDTYTKALEAITAAVLVGGYLYWAFLFLTQ